MYQLNQENTQKLEKLLNYYVDEGMDVFAENTIVDYKNNEYAIRMVENIARILERFSGNKEKTYDCTTTYTSNGE